MLDALCDAVCWCVMSLEEAWRNSFGLKLIMTLVSGLILAGVSGMWVMNAKLSVIEGKIQAFQASAIQDHQRYDRYIERRLRAEP